MLELSSEQRKKYVLCLREHTKKEAQSKLYERSMKANILHCTFENQINTNLLSTKKTSINVIYVSKCNTRGLLNCLSNTHNAMHVI